jgi:ketosteroid isomerase-like protein
MRRTLLKVGITALALVIGVSAQSLSNSVAAQAVMQVDEEFRVAKLKKDTATLERIVAEDYYGMNQNGNGRNKKELIELFKTFSISTLTTDTFQVRVAGDTAFVTGTQTEDGADKMVFLRVYMYRSGNWQLTASMQARDPHRNVLSAR